MTEDELKLVETVVREATTTVLTDLYKKFDIPNVHNRLNQWAAMLNLPEGVTPAEIMTEVENKAFAWRPAAGQNRGVLDNTISSGVFCDLLVHGFDNDPGAEKILLTYLVVKD